MNLNEVTLEKVTFESITKLENLMSLYLHDLSEYASDLKISNNGKFEYEGLDLYFKAEDLHPFFITHQGETAGFVLLNSGKYVPRDIDYEVHELFLLKGYRKKGISTAAINNLLNLYKGTYKIVQIASNSPAIHFWTNFYKRNGINYTEVNDVFDGIDGRAQIFKN